MLARKKQKLEDIEEESEYDGDHCAAAAVFLSSRSFKSISLITEYEDPDTKTKMFGIALILLSGVGRGEWNTEVINGGISLELTLNWPQELVNLYWLNKKVTTTTYRSRQRSLSEIYPRYLGFENAMRHLRERKDGKITSRRVFASLCC